MGNENIVVETYFKFDLPYLKAEDDAPYETEYQFWVPIRNILCCYVLQGNLNEKIQCLQKHMCGSVASAMAFRQADTV